MLMSYDFRCPNGHEFEDLSRYEDDRVRPVPCHECAAEAFHFWKIGTRMAMRGDFSLTERETRSAELQYGERVVTRDDLNRLMKKHGHDLAVDGKTMAARVAEVAKIDDKAPETVEELNKGLTAAEIEKRRAGTIADIRKVRDLRAAGKLPKKELPADMPAEVRNVIGK